MLRAEQLPDEVSFTQKDGLYAEKTDSGRVTHFAFYRDGDVVGWSLHLSEGSLLASKLEKVSLPDPHDPEDELTQDEILGWVHRIAGYQGQSMVCSFCEKTNLEVEKLIAGPECYICNECVDLCSEIISAD